MCAFVRGSIFLLDAVSGMGSSLANAVNVLGWLGLRFLRACADSRTFSICVSTLFSFSIWTLVGVSLRVSALPLLFSFVITLSFTLHSITALLVSLYRPIVCSVRLSINEEVTLVYRSWWPRGLSLDEIRRFSVESATDSARAWYASCENRPKKCLSMDEAACLTTEYLTTFTEPLVDETCPICLDPILEGSRSLKVCSHRYCLPCIARWFARGRFSCPYCRSDHSVYIPVEIIDKRNELYDAPVISVASVQIVQSGESQSTDTI